MSTPPHGSPWPPPDPGTQPWPPPDPRRQHSGPQSGGPWDAPAAPVGGEGGGWGQPSYPYPQNGYPPSPNGQNPYGSPPPGNAYPPQSPLSAPYAPAAHPPTEPQNAYWATPSGQGYPQGLPAPGEPGRDPRAPIGGHVPASVSIRQFSAESSRKPVLITLAVLLVVAVAVWLGVRTATQDPTIPAPSAVPSTPPAAATVGNASSIPFDNTFDNAHGVWTIDSYTWSGPRAVVKMTFKVTSGDQVLQFFAFTNSNTNQAYEPHPSNRPDDLVGHTVHAGESVSGTVTFDMPDSESTLFLLDSAGRQVTALILPA